MCLKTKLYCYGKDEVYDLTKVIATEGTGNTKHITTEERPLMIDVQVYVLKLYNHSEINWFKGGGLIGIRGMQ